jgi:Amt family ammonium transporter
MESTINTGDTAWILIATALVTMMTPALAFFYGGMVRKKNLLSTLNLSFITMGLIGVQWVLVGYTLAFGPSLNGLIGRLDFWGLNGVGAEPDPNYSATIPALAFTFSNDLCGHHSGADHRRICRTNPLQGVLDLHRVVGDPHL